MSRTIAIFAAVAMAVALPANRPASAQRAGDAYQESDAQDSQDTQQEQDSRQDAEGLQEEEGLQEAERIPDQPFDAGKEDEDRGQFDRQPVDRTQSDRGQDDAVQRQPRQQDFNFGARFSDSENALTVGSINQGTIAADIGLQADDEIIAVGDRAVFSEEDLNQALRRSSTTQDRIPIVVRRGTGRTTLFIEPQTLRGSLGIARGMGRADLGLTWRTGANDQLIVRDVTGGLGARLGLRARDVVLSVGGRRIASPVQFERWLYDVDFVDARRLPIVVLRDGRRVTLYLEPEMVEYRFRGRDFYEDPGFYREQEAWLGVTLDPSYDDFAVVQSVVANSPAEQAGVRPGDWIVRLNGRRVNSPSHLTSLVRSMEPGEELDIQIARRVSRTLTARLDADPSSVPRQALRPTFEEFDGRGDVIPEGRRYFRPDMYQEFDPDIDRRGLRDRVGPGERGLRDRLDPDERPDEPRGVLPR